jgi:protein-disulfide isomerase
VAWCAAGVGHFTEIHDELFTIGDWKEDGQFGGTLSGLAPNVASSILMCADSDAARSAIDEDVALAHAFGVRGTPTAITRSGVYIGAAALAVTGSGSAKDK